jgi:hypothetical protein
MRDRDLVQGLERAGELVGPHLHAPGVGGNGGDLGPVQPAGGGERQARGRTAGIVSPALTAGTGQPAGADQHDVAPADGHAVGRCRRGQVVLGDREAVRQFPRGAGHTAGIKQHGAAGDLGRHVLDAGDQVACGCDHLLRGAAVPRLAVVEDVAKPVPLRGALQRHRDHVVGAADPVREALVAQGRVGAGVHHGVYRVDAAPPPVLRAAGLKPQRQREADAQPDERGALGPFGLVKEVQRAEHVGLAPAAPVAVPGGRLGDGAFGVRGLGCHRAASAEVSATQRVRWEPSPVMEPSMTSPSRSSRPRAMPLPAGLPVSTRSPGSSRAACEM